MFTVCYLGMGNGLSVWGTFSSKESAMDALEARNFKNSSLDGTTFYIIECTLYTKTTPNE